MSCCSKKTTTDQLMVVSNKAVDKANSGFYFEANYIPYYNDLNSRGKKYIKMDKMVRVDTGLARQLTEASYELHSMCLEVVEMVVRSDQLLRLFEIPQSLWGFIRKSWGDRQTDLMARFDFLIDGGQPKLLEYNADTPTLLVECGVAQRYLFDQFRPNHPSAFDFNFVGEGLKAAWADRIVKTPATMHIGIGCDISEIKSEDYSHSNYVRLMAEQAVATLGLAPAQVQVHMIALNDIVFEPGQSKLKCPSKGVYLDILWKLYPYEWMAKEQISLYFDFISRLPSGTLPAPTYILEPPWKLIMSSKALLPFLWATYPDHPNLLPAYFENPYFVEGSPGTKYESLGYKKWIMKPRYGREGVCNYIAKNEELKKNRTPEGMRPDDYFGTPIFQVFQEGVKVEGLHVCASSWIVNGLPMGYCFRYSEEEVTDTGCYYMPFFTEGDFFGEFRATEVQKNIRNSLYINEVGHLNVYGPRAGNFTFKITNNIPVYAVASAMAGVQLGGNIQPFGKEFSPLPTSHDMAINGHGYINTVPTSQNLLPVQPLAQGQLTSYQPLNTGVPQAGGMITPMLPNQMTPTGIPMAVGQPGVVIQPQVTLQPTGYYGTQRWSTPYAAEDDCCFCFYRPVVPYYRRGFWGGYSYRWPFYTTHRWHGGYRRHSPARTAYHGGSWGGHGGTRTHTGTTSRGGWGGGFGGGFGG